MGVDLSVIAGVGFIIYPEIWMLYVEENRDEYGEEREDWDLMEELLEDSRGLLTYGDGGSYYDDTPITHYIGVKRLTQGGDSDDLVGGIKTWEGGSITTPEFSELVVVANKIGVLPITVTNFLAVLWH